jgi:hypothetical protein
VFCITWCNVDCRTYRKASRFKWDAVTFVLAAFGVVTTALVWSAIVLLLTVPPDQIHQNQDQVTMQGLGLPRRRS